MSDFWGNLPDLIDSDQNSDRRYQLILFWWFIVSACINNLLGPTVWIKVDCNSKQMSKLGDRLVRLVWNGRGQIHSTKSGAQICLVRVQLFESFSLFGDHFVCDLRPLCRCVSVTQSLCFYSQVLTKQPPDAVASCKLDKQRYLFYFLNCYITEELFYLCWM